MNELLRQKTKQIKNSPTPYDFSLLQDSNDSTLPIMSSPNGRLNLKLPTDLSAEKMGKIQTLLKQLSDICPTCSGSATPKGSVITGPRVPSVYPRSREAQTFGEMLTETADEKYIIITKSRHDELIEKEKKYDRLSKNSK